MHYAMHHPKFFADFADKSKNSRKITGFFKWNSFCMGKNSPQELRGFGAKATKMDNNGYGRMIKGIAVIECTGQAAEDIRHIH
jgi:hypothetical protein